MEKMLESWEEVNFVFVPYKDTKVSVMAAPDDIQMMLDDHIVKTTTMKNSPFIAPFEKQVNAWDERLVRTGLVAVFVVSVCAHFSSSQYMCAISTASQKTACRSG